MNAKKSHISQAIELFSIDTQTTVDLPVIEEGISAGFPSPAGDFLDTTIDLNKELIQNPSSTFFGRVRGDSMIGAGLDDGDLLIIDKSLAPSDGKIAICFIDGDFTCKRIRVDKNVVWLVAENKLYKPIKVTKEDDFLIWGIVTTVIKSV
jgi:DNA polymerase V